MAICKCKKILAIQGWDEHLERALRAIYPNPCASSKFYIENAVPSTWTAISGNLSDYDAILIGSVINSNISGRITTALNTAGIADWIFNGGTLIAFSELQSASYGYIPATLKPINATSLNPGGNAVTIVDATNEIFTGLNNTSLSNWNYSFDSYFSNIPTAISAVWNKLATGTVGANQQPIIISTNYGSGRILLTGQSVDKHADDGNTADKEAAKKLLQNMLTWACKTGTGCDYGECCECNPQLSCQVLLEHGTQLVPPADTTQPIDVYRRVEAKIEKVCPEKVVICGILHKKIVYTAIDDCGKSIPNFEKYDDACFECFVDKKDCNDDCTDACFKITGTAIECIVISKPTCFGSHHSTNGSVAWRYKEKEVIKITVRRESTTTVC